jgi:hypothetical protein
MRSRHLVLSLPSPVELVSRGDWTHVRELLFPYTRQEKKAGCLPFLLLSILFDSSHDKAHAKPRCVDASHAS